MNNRIVCVCEGVTDLVGFFLDDWWGYHVSKEFFNRDVKNTNDSMDIQF